MKKTVFILSCFLLGWGTTHVFAQQGFVAAGGDGTGTGGSMSYSIGQVDYVSASSSSHYIIQGLQQPREISNVGINEAKVELTASVYPNPMKENLTLKMEVGDMKNLYYQLYDEQGRLLMSNRIVNEQTTLNISYLSSSHYFLKVFNDNQELKTFKITKLF